MNEVRITAIRVAPDAVITKGRMNTGSMGFILPVTYVTADGREHASRVSTQRKKDLLPHLESERENAANGSMTVSYDENGSFWGTSTRYYIGPRGLQPETAVS